MANTLETFPKLSQTFDETFDIYVGFVDLAETFRLDWSLVKNMNEMKCLHKKMEVGSINIGNLARPKRLSILLALPLVAGLATESFAQTRQTGNGSIAVMQSALQSSTPRRAVEAAVVKAGLDCNKLSTAIDILEAVITGKEVVVKTNTGHGFKVQIDLDTGLPLTEQVTSYSLEFGNAAQARSFASTLKAGLNDTGKNIQIQRDGNSVIVENIRREKRLQFSEAEAQ